MSRVFVISDLHLGHKNILRFSGALRSGTTVDEHDEWIVEQCNSVLTKRDWLFILGDVCMDRSKLPLLGKIRGNKRLVMGNHDELPLEEYQKYFVSIHALVKYKGFWLSHAPIHPDELRGRRNIHGHVHHNTLRDDRYINACVEASFGVPQEIITYVTSEKSISTCS